MSWLLVSRRVRPVFIGLILSASLGACKVAQPVPPIPVDGANPNGDSPQPSSFTHNFGFNWTGNEAVAIQKLSVIHPVSIHVVGSPSTDELSLSLSLDVQPDQHNELAQAYEKEVALNSDFASTTPHILLPTRDCQETRDQDNRVTSVQGVCVRELVISVPPQARIEFDFTYGHGIQMEDGQSPLTTLHLPTHAATSSVVSNWGGAIAIHGGNSQSSIAIQDLAALENAWSGLSASLNSIGNFTMTALTGRIQIDLQSTTDSNVSLDGRPIQNFPFVRP